MRKRIPTILAALALGTSVMALCLGAAMATGILITSKQIKNGTILSQDIKNNQIKSNDLTNNGIRTADISNNAVEAPQIDVPNPKQLEEESASSAPVGDDFSRVDDVGVYNKQEPDTALQVEWIGTAEGAIHASCIFQLRVDGTPAPGGGSEWLLPLQQRGSLTLSDVFPGLPAGPHEIEVWARAGTKVGEGPYMCVIGPPGIGIAQIFLVAEVVL